MKPLMPRPFRCSPGSGLATACAWVAIVALSWGATVPALGQCNPQEIVKLIASDAAAADRFGSAVAVSGDTAVVGSADDDDAGSSSGSAYVFVRTNGVWTQQQKLTAADAAADDKFGFSVAISGDTIVVGAYRDDFPSNLDAGSAYVFVRGGGVWTQQQKLIASNLAGADNFGHAVAIDGDTVAVGANGHNTSAGSDAGMVYVFVRSGGLWSEQQQLTASDAAANDNFGFSVALSGNTVLAGAYDDSRPGLSVAGAAYVFTRSGNVWTEEQKLIASDAANLDRFGAAVALDGDTAIVAAPWDDFPIDAGSAYVFTRTAGVWTQQQKLTASDAAESDFFAWSVAVSGNTALLGAIGFEQSGAALNTGAAYVFTRAAGVWTQRQTLIASDRAAGDQGGNSVSLWADTAIFGAFTDSNSGGSTAGSAYVFDLNCTSCTGDVNGNAAVDLTDLATLLAHFGLLSGATLADGDLDGDFDVDLGDLTLLLANFGTTCP